MFHRGNDTPMLNTWDDIQQSLSKVFVFLTFDKRHQQVSWPIKSLKIECWSTKREDKIHAVNENAQKEFEVNDWAMT